MAEYDGIYVGNGIIETFAEMIMGDHLRIYIPNDLKADYQLNKSNLKIHTVSYKRVNN